MRTCLNNIKRYHFFVVCFLLPPPHLLCRRRYRLSLLINYSRQDPAYIPNHTVIFPILFIIIFSLVIVVIFLFSFTHLRTLKEKRPHLLCVYLNLNNGVLYETLSLYIHIPQKTLLYIQVHTGREIE